MAEVDIPTPSELMYPALQALAEAGGSATRTALKKLVPRMADVSEEQLAVVFSEEDGNVEGKWGKSKVIDRMGWALTKLKELGAVANPKWSVWEITDAGHNYLKMEPGEAVKALEKAKKELKSKPSPGRDIPPVETGQSQDGPGFLAKLRSAWAKTKEDLGEKLLVEVDFLEEIISLLEDKGQVIFYGPPGTGKTFLARKLAGALTNNDPRRQTLVQFHPSTSYEDFFEGYRPKTENGQMVYHLEPGPLAQMAEKASNHPNQLHVMVIDEINRANLPKVLGELLFAFEYRDQAVSPLYRSDQTFSLPHNLWFIGTMNTADRSIALVDAALRRRFHFIPFFPHHGSMKGLLDRWLHANDQPAWVGDLVAMVNDELKEDLGGPHLQLGASHFMKQGINQESLQTIWKYNIEPFIEDQFFGDPKQIEKFRYDKVYRRYQYRSGMDETGDQQDTTPPDIQP